MRACLFHCSGAAALTPRVSLSLCSLSLLPLAQHAAEAAAHAYGGVLVGPSAHAFVVVLGGDVVLSHLMARGRARTLLEAAELRS